MNAIEFDETEVRAYGQAIDEVVNYVHRLMSPPQEAYSAKFSNLVFTITTPASEIKSHQMKYVKDINKRYPTKVAKIQALKELSGKIIRAAKKISRDNPNFVKRHPDSPIDRAIIAYEQQWGEKP